MIVKVKAFGEYREVLGKTVEIELGEGATVEVLLDSLILSYDSFKDMVFDESGKIKGDVNILINGRHIQSLEGEATGLDDGDEMAIFPTVVGG